MGRRLAAFALLLLACGCTRQGGGGSFLAVAPATSAAPPVSSTPTAPPPAPPRVALTQRGIAIDGKVRAILGGEVQYYRCRDPQWDVARTHKLWESALDELIQAGGTMVTTYVPWDYHEEVEGKLDFTGVRDLDLFLEMCWKRGLLVTIKPGPFINSEWPNGLGSFGAVPQWWKDKNPSSLALGSDGKFFSFDLLGQKEGRQPSFFAPDFRAATARWFSIVAPTIKRYIVDRPSIVLLQIDNETNFYFKSRFASDYSDHGKKQYRDFLTKKYGSLAGKNPDPPTKAGDNAAVQDWFDAGLEGVAEYHAFLRATWESLGIREPDVLFTTNDSPHAMPTMDLLLWDGETKNRSGVASLDAYPKQFPWSFDRPLDYPFLTSFFTKRFMVESGTKGALGAELEGGLFDLPLGIVPNVPVATTDHILLEFYSHGGVAGVIYTFRGGLNRDGSRYFGMAPLDENGVRTPRFDAVARWGVNAVNDDLLRSREVESKVALVVGARFMGPADGVAGHPGWIQAKEAPAILGWLEDAGVQPAILDGGKLKKGDLDGFDLVVHVNPDATEGDLVPALESFVAKGGVLLNLLHLGGHDASWQPTAALPGGLLSDGALTGSYEEKLGFVL
ncbi:MAG: beta-galactosidase, partial [Planctomycetota bacterium]